jgi:hypothetical protein
MPYANWAVVHFSNKVKPIQRVASCLSVKYEDVSLSLCIMLWKRVLCIWYLRRKYDGGTHNHHWSIHATASNESLYDHGWCSVDNTSVVVSMKNHSPPLREFSWLAPWRLKMSWWFDPSFLLDLNEDIVCVCVKRVEMSWYESNLSSNCVCVWGGGGYL